MKRQRNALAPVVPVHQFHFFRSHGLGALRIEDERQMRILVGANRGHEVAARRGAQHILKQAQIEVVMQLAPRKVMKLQAARGWRCYPQSPLPVGSLVQLRGRRVGKAHHHLVEVVVKLFRVA
jgi:hypothetical protein